MSERAGRRSRRSRTGEWKMTVRGALRPAAVLRADWLRRPPALRHPARAALQSKHVPHALRNSADSLTGSAERRRIRSRTGCGAAATRASARLGSGRARQCWRCGCAHARRVGNDPSGAATTGSDWTSSGADRGAPQASQRRTYRPIKTAIARGLPAPSQQWSGVRRSSQPGHRGGAPAL
jgi:hypothetical protein